MRDENAQYPNFLNKDDPFFTSFFVALDNRFKQLCAKGVGATLKRTEGISDDKESLLWTSGVLNIHSPKGLLRAIFYYNGKYFCFRGGQEHRSLGVSQLKRPYDPDRYEYFEHSSKNRKGGLVQHRLEHKAVTIFLILVLVIVVTYPCWMYLLVSFHLKQFRKIFLIADPSVGKNQLAKMVSDMYSEAKISGKKPTTAYR